MKEAAQPPKDDQTSLNEKNNELAHEHKERADHQDLTKQGADKKTASEGKPLETNRLSAMSCPTLVVPCEVTQEIPRSLKGNNQTKSKGYCLLPCQVFLFVI